MLHDPEDHGEQEADQAEQDDPGPHLRDRERALELHDGRTEPPVGAIVQFQRGFAIPEMWSGIIFLGLLGVVLALLFRLVEARALRWYEGVRAAERAGRP